MAQAWRKCLWQKHVRWIRDCRCLANRFTPQSTGGGGIRKEDSSPPVSQDDYLLILGLSSEKFGPSILGSLPELGSRSEVAQ